MIVQGLRTARLTLSALDAVLPLLRDASETASGFWRPAYLFGSASLKKLLGVSTASKLWEKLGKSWEKVGKNCLPANLLTSPSRFIFSVSLTPLVGSSRPVITFMEATAFQSGDVLFGVLWDLFLAGMEEAGFRSFSEYVTTTRAG